MTHLAPKISLLGIVIDGLGGLYLAYDLLGGKRGPLRILTRGVTYSALFGIGYWLTLDPVFGIVGGIGIGTSLALEAALTGPWFRIPVVRSAFFCFLPRPLYRNCRKFGLWIALWRMVWNIFRARASHRLHKRHFSKSHLFRGRQTKTKLWQCRRFAVSCRGRCNSGCPCRKAAARRRSSGSLCPSSWICSRDSDTRWHHLGPFRRMVG